MKKNIIVLLCAFFMCSSLVANSVTQNSVVLGSIEKQIFGFEYKSDSDIGRINRIENYLYGTTYVSNNLQVRLKKISGDIGFVSGDNASGKPSQETIKSASTGAAAPIQKTIKEDPSVQYPIVDKLELKVFNKNYSGENIYSRLDRLEKKVYNTTTNDSLNNRVDKLKASLYGVTDDIASNLDDDIDSASSSVDDQTPSYNDEEQQTATDKQTDSYSSTQTSKTSSHSSHLNRKLSSIEGSVLRETYPNDSVNERLDRLEYKIFKRNFDSDTSAIRLQRISAATSAHKSAKMYDNNKLMRNLSTGVQIGGFLLMILAMFL